jgi:hypothetical protein
LSPSGCAFPEALPAVSTLRKKLSILFILLILFQVLLCACLFPSELCIHPHRSSCSWPQAQRCVQRSSRDWQHLQINWPS